MEAYINDVRFVSLPPMLVLDGTAVGSEPEEEIMGRMNRLAASFDLVVGRRFGFDSPVTAEQAAAHFRGYTYWLSIGEESLATLPSPESFEFEGTRVTVRRIAACRYATLRITDPFADPFVRIGGGFRYLADWLQDHETRGTTCAAPECAGSSSAPCLEEIGTVNGITVMDIYIPVPMA